MAISDDTNALVAAHLTVAWAVRSGARDYDRKAPTDEEILGMFGRFKEQIAAPPGKPFNLGALLE